MIAMEVITLVERMIKLYKIIYKEVDEKIINYILRSLLFLYIFFMLVNVFRKSLRRSLEGR